MWWSFTHPHFAFCRMLKKSASLWKVKAQAQVEIKKVASSLNLDRDLSLPRLLRLTPVWSSLPWRQVIYLLLPCHSC
jgi:hypothetical protein